MRSRRRRLQRQRKKTGRRFYYSMNQFAPYPRVWGRPRGCFDHIKKEIA